jgi:hypothetical protein
MQRALKQPVEPFLEQSGMRHTSVVARKLLEQNALTRAMAYQERSAHA